MSTPLARFKSLLSEGWTIQEIALEHRPTESPESKATLVVVEGKGVEVYLPSEGSRYTVKLSKDSKGETIESDDAEFKSHIAHYRSLPNLVTREIELVYVDDIETYHDFEEKFVEFTCGVKPNLSVRETETGLSELDRRRITVAIETWVETEKPLTRFPTRLPRLFYDILVLLSSEGKFDCRILERDRCEINEPLRVLPKQGEIDWAYAFACVLLCPKVTDQFHRDAVIVVALYDLVKRRVIAGSLGTLRSLFNYADRGYTPGMELYEAIRELALQILAQSQGRVIVTAPFRDSEFTPVPWVCYALLAQLPVKRLNNLPNAPIGEVILFGDSGIPRNRSSLDFKRKPQTAALIFESRYNGDNYRWILRFDRSAGESKFHVDFEVLLQGNQNGAKFLEHYPVLLRDVWALSQNLYLAFVAAGAYDVKFDALITRAIKDFDQLLREEPLAAYPLIYRGFIEPVEKWLAANPDALALIRKFWENERYSPTNEERKLLSSLESQGLWHSRGITQRGIWIMSRSDL